MGEPCFILHVVGEGGLALLCFRLTTRARAHSLTFCSATRGRLARGVISLVDRKAVPTGESLLPTPDGASRGRRPRRLRVWMLVGGGCVGVNVLLLVLFCLFYFLFLFCFHEVAAP